MCCMYDTRSRTGRLSSEPPTAWNLCHKITSGRIQLGCDNEKVVWLSSTYLPQLSSHTKHVDLVRAIRALVQSIPVTIDFQHIDGHQDEKIPFHQLDRMAQLNMWMDEEVKHYLRYLISLPSAPSLPRTIYKEGWSCWVGGMKVMTNLSDLIKHAVYGRELCEWLHQQEHLDKEVFDLVDWDANGDAFTNFPTLFGSWATKHISGICGVGKMMKIWNFWEDSACLSCDELREMTHHVVLCPCVERMVAWDKAIDGLEEWMTAVDMDPEIQYCICQALQSRDLAHLFMAYTGERYSGCSSRARQNWVDELPRGSDLP